MIKKLYPKCHPPETHRGAATIGFRLDHRGLSTQTSKTGRIVSNTQSTISSDKEYAKRRYVHKCGARQPGTSLHPFSPKRTRSISPKQFKGVKESMQAGERHRRYVRHGSARAPGGPLHPDLPTSASPPRVRADVDSADLSALSSQFRDGGQLQGSIVNATRFSGHSTLRPDCGREEQVARNDVDPAYLSGLNMPGHELGHGSHVERSLNDISKHTCTAKTFAASSANLLDTARRTSTIVDIRSHILPRMQEILCDQMCTISGPRLRYWRGGGVRQPGASLLRSESPSGLTDDERRSFANSGYTRSKTSVLKLSESSGSPSCR